MKYAGIYVSGVLFFFLFFLLFSIFHFPFSIFFFPFFRFPPPPFLCRARCRGAARS